MSIKLQTSKGTDIPNSQENTEHSLLYLKQLNDLKVEYVGSNFKSGPSQTYNCHGMTFANRRTGIYENEIISRILNDDSYIEIKRKDIMPGDIVLYFSQDGDAEHSGVILQCPSHQEIAPKILSKWGSSFEVIHSLYLCPYEKSNIKYYRCLL